MYNRRIQDMTRPLPFQAMTSSRAPPGQTCIPQWGCRWNPWLPLQRPGQELHPPATRPEGSHRISDPLMEWHSVFLEHMQHMDIWWYMDISTKKKHLNHQICWSTSRCCILSHKPICWIDWYTTLYSTTLLKVVSHTWSFSYPHPTASVSTACTFNSCEPGTWVSKVTQW